MKRINLWMRELSLTQQVLVIVFGFISLFGLFLMTVLSPALDAFTRSESYMFLHNAQEGVLYVAQNYPEDELPEIYNNDISYVTYGIYDPVTQEFSLPKGVVFPEECIEDIRIRAKDPIVGTQDYEVVEKNEGRNDAITYLYSLTEMQDGRVLASVMSNDYRASLRANIVSGILNVNIIVVSVLFILMILWVSTLLVPLNQIKIYIKKLKNNEEAELNVHRRDAIGEVADALRDMNMELKRQNREKEEMIQNISHDLKTPIATIKSYSEAIKDGIYPYETLEKSIDVIIEHADRLLQKVQSLIILNKMDYLSDQCPEGDTVDMNGIIDKVILSLKVVRPEISLEKDVEESVFFHGMEDPWRNVVENLVDNALRYAKTYIRLTLKENELCVINDGIQIDDDSLEKIFRPYEKGSGGKFGLGLSIVNKVCKEYGYHVDAENLKEGVCFRIWRDSKKRKPRNKNKNPKKGG